jgi:hypothetical protein
VKGAVKEVHGDVTDVDVSAVGIELEPGATEVIDERRKAAAAAHGPVQQ